MAQRPPSELVPGGAKGAGPQIALAGRSNVGKSSLINALCRRSIARTSAAPGKTRLANLYRVTIVGGPGGPGRHTLHFVDLPGYGYARGGRAAAGELRAVAEAYLTSANGPDAVLLLVDARHPGLESDQAAAGWLDQLRPAWHLVATKIDKLSRAERARSLRRCEDTFGTAALPVSAASGEGLDDLWKLIARPATRT
ncbi:MAG TPA: ribosome biogenesis GTP-binding protein YihA/YsxC [Vicinamibacterales bacterium]|nr:ribosome biogenesis GTP-binding protein YihA/YsxC [Vicinamibacterales bacterium]